MSVWELGITADGLVRATSGASIRSFGTRLEGPAPVYRWGNGFRDATLESALFRSQVENGQNNFP